jgi:hypothetical protein
MKKCLVAATLIAIFATPALAGEFYLAADLASGKCMVMASPPNPGQFKMMGHYKSRAAAHKAMASRKAECK